jgi:CRP-like cAMP-binding protein
MPKNRLSSVRPLPRAERPPPSDGRPKNRLLAALPADDFNRLRPHLQTVPVRARQVLHKIGEPLDVVYFLNGGVASITTTLPDGTMVEAATVGDEGMVGIEAFLNDHPVAPGEVLMQVPDTNAAMLSVDRFREELARHGALHSLMGRYTEVVIAQMMQSTACNALHQVPQRCARWLLTTHDRMHEQDFHLSHEFLAMMLGVQRPTVTVVAGTLQHAGLIRYIHGRVTVRNRKGLEAASCECYGIVRAHFNRLRHSPSG